MKRINWLHLTDLHCGQKEQNWLWPNVREAFYQDLTKMYKKIASPIDLVLFTGDLVFSGKKNEYDQLEQILKDLWQHFKKLGSTPYLLTVPGNHDLTRPEEMSSIALALNNWKENSKLQEYFWDKDNNEYYLAIQTIFKEYNDWLDRTTIPLVQQNYPCQLGLLPGDIAATIEINNISLGIVGLNSTFLQLTKGDYEKKLDLDIRQFNKVCENDPPKWIKKHNVRMLLTHQPPSWLLPKAQEVYKGEIVGRNNFLAHIYGHMHESNTEYVSIGGSPTRRFIQGISLFGMEHIGDSTDKQRIHGYNIGSIEIEDDDNGILKIWPRKATKLQAGYYKVDKDERFDLDDDEAIPPSIFLLEKKTKLELNASAALKAKIIEFSKQTSIQKYLQHIKEKYNTIRILGMREPIPLTNIFTKVRILETITSRHRSDIQELEQYLDRNNRKFSLQKEVKDGLEVINKEPKLMVLGKPGAGKSTFLKHIVLQTIDGALKTNRLPIFISLKELSDNNKSLMDSIEAEFDRCQYPNAKKAIESLLSNGQCIILLDGLDEVDKTKENQIINDIQSFTGKYTSNRFVLSCRIAASSYVFDKFTDVEMADFNEEQVNIFIKNWFDSNKQKGQLCLKALSKDPPIRELATIPLLLALLCIVFDESMRFPKNRAELYEEAIATLLKRWDSTRNIDRQEVYRNLSLKRKQNMLAQIAYLTFKAGEYFIPEKVLRTYITDFYKDTPDVIEESLEADSEVILKSMEAQHGIFVERARGIYSFSHLTFQEYFAAKYIENNKDKLLIPLVDNYLTNDQWQEIYLLITNLLSKADDFLLLIKERIDSLIDEPIVQYVRLIDSNEKLQKFIFANISKEKLGYTLTNIVNFYFARDFAHNRALTKALASARALSIAIDLGLKHAGVRNDNFSLAFARSLARYRNPEFNFDILSNIAYKFANNLKYELNSDLKHDLNGKSAYGRAREVARDRDLADIFEIVYTQNINKNLRLYELSTKRLIECLATEVDLSKDVQQQLIKGLYAIL